MIAGNVHLVEQISGNVGAILGDPLAELAAGKQIREVRRGTRCLAHAGGSYFPPRASSSRANTSKS